MNGNGKTTKAKPKMADVTKPKKLSTEDQLVIQSRPIIGRATSVSSPVDEEKKPGDAASATAPVLPSQSKRTLIVPISDGSEQKADDAPSASSAPAPAEDKVPAAEPAPKEVADVKPAEKPTPEPTSPKKEAAAPEADDEKAAEADDDEDEDSKAGAKDEKPSPETEKALKEAAAAEKRANELQSLIDSKQFYVPINAVAQRRSIKYSSLMTVAVFLLSIVLIDLMLDTGMILLVQKIPHTHFFSSNSQNG